MKSKIIVVTIGILFFITLVVLLSFLNERARHAFEDEQYCESYKIVKWTSYISKEGKQILGLLFARGLCPPQDIELAKKMYAAKVRSSSQEIGKQLFYDAIAISKRVKRTGHKKRTQEIQNLFSEAKRLGFTPSNDDISELKKENLNEDYESSTSSGE